MKSGAVVIPLFLALSKGMGYCGVKWCKVVVLESF